MIFYFQFQSSLLTLVCPSWGASFNELCTLVPLMFHCTVTGIIKFCTKIRRRFSFYICELILINNRRLFNVEIDDLAEKPYIPHKSLLQWICSKCLAWWYRHSHFWPQRSWRLLEAKNTSRTLNKTWKSWFIRKSI